MTSDNPDSSYPADRRLRVRRDLGVLAAGLVAFVLFRLLFMLPGVVETVYASGIGPLVVRPMSLVSGLVPISLVEVAIVSYAMWVLLAIGRGVLDVRNERRSIRNLTMAAGLRTARDAGVLILLFYVLWGFNYARPPLVERLGWPEWQPPEVGELEALATEAIDAANQAYWDIHHTEDAGEPTPMPADLGELDLALEEGWRRAAELLDLPAALGRRYGRTKRLLLTPIVARLGVGGFYFPWTGEANVLWDSPAVRRPQSMAHEKAHQRGTGPESEASFLGFVAAAHAPHPHARYAAYVFAQGQLLGMLARADRGKFRRVAMRRYPGVQRDLADDAVYWSQFRGVGTSLGRSINDRFLRTNRVRGGLTSYRRSVRLLLTFAKQNGGTLVPGG
ncbi:MAG: DUF3810 domain-containing protein [Gemmatimonadetes bacterium]|nr:DUF3810 domain-containing protein [Gemmatimonadota bacterium]